MTPDAALVDTAELARADAWWRAANYLSVGQIYLLDNPLLLEPLRAEHIKARLLGHWGTTPGLNFIHAHLNRAITGRDRNIMFVIGPGHGGPGPMTNMMLRSRPVMTRFRWAWMKLRPGVVPQWPSRRALMCSARNGSSRSGLSSM